MAPMRILYLITKATHGGAQLYVREMAKAAASKGFVVSVAHGTPGRLVDELTDDGVRCIAIPRLGRDIRLLDEFLVFVDLTRLLRRERPDVLNVNSSKAGGLGALAARIAGVRTIIYTAHGWPHKEPRSVPARVLIWILSWVTIFLSTSVIVVSNDDLNRAPVFFSRKKIKLVRNGIGSFPLLTKEEARAALAQKDVRLEPNDQWLLALGELHPNKGFDVLIQSFAKVLPSHPNLRLVMLGAGDEEARLRTLVAESGSEGRVHLLGFIPNGKSYLAAADIFVFPSRKEGLPFALLEAGNAGLPVIASDVGGIPEVIVPQKTGLLVPPQNPERLADAIHTLLTDPERAKQYGTALKAYVEQEFSKERMIRETLALYAR